MFATVSQDKTMTRIRLYTRALCGWCIDAKEYLRQQQIAFEEVDVGRNPAALAEMVRLSGQHYVPTLAVDDHVLADFDVGQLRAFLARINAEPR